MNRRTLLATMATLFITIFAFAPKKALAFGAEGPEVVTSANDFDTTVSKIKADIQAKGIAIVFEANHKNMLAMVGIESDPSLTIGFAKPDMASMFLSKEPRSALEMPLRVTVRQLADGSVVVVYYVPSVLFGHYGNQMLTKMATEKADPMVKAIVTAGTTH